MAVGLRTWDAAGNPIIDVTDRLMRFIGYVIVSSSGSLTNDGLLTGNPFYVAVMYANNGSGYFPGDNMYPLSVSFSGNQMFWTFNAGQPTQIIQYGVR